MRVLREKKHLQAALARSERVIELMTMELGPCPIMRYGDEDLSQFCDFSNKTGRCKHVESDIANECWQQYFTAKAAAEEKDGD